MSISGKLKLLLADVLLSSSKGMLQLAFNMIVSYDPELDIFRFAACNAERH